MSPYALYGTSNVTSTVERPDHAHDGVEKCPVDTVWVTGKVVSDGLDLVVVRKPADVRKESRDTRGTLSALGHGTDSADPCKVTLKTVEDVPVLGLLLNMTKDTLAEDTPKTHDRSRKQPPGHK